MQRTLPNSNLTENKEEKDSIIMFSPIRYGPPLTDKHMNTTNVSIKQMFVDKEKDKNQEKKEMFRNSSQLMRVAGTSMTNALIEQVPGVTTKVKDTRPFEVQRDEAVLSNFKKRTTSNYDGSPILRLKDERDPDFIKLDQPTNHALKSNYIFNPYMSKFSNKKGNIEMFERKINHQSKRNSSV